MKKPKKKPARQRPPTKKQVIDELRQVKADRAIEINLRYAAENELTHTKALLQEARRAAEIYTRKDIDRHEALNTFGRQYAETIERLCRAHAQITGTDPRQGRDSRLKEALSKVFDLL
jgi:rRNA-processing protein FCF1